MSFEGSAEENERRKTQYKNWNHTEQTEQFQEQLSSLESGLQSSEDKLTILEILKKHLVQRALGLQDRIPCQRTRDTYKRVSCRIQRW